MRALRQEVGSDLEKCVWVLGVQPVARTLNGVVVHVQELCFQLFQVVVAT